MSGGHHVVSDHYPRILRLAEIYTTRIDWMMSGDDSEESMHKRLKVELEEFEEKYASKDWTILEEDE